MIQACKGAQVTVKDLVVENDGWALVPLPEEDQRGDIAESDLVRGYLLERRQEAIIEVCAMYVWSAISQVSFSTRTYVTHFLWCATRITYCIGI